MLNINKHTQSCVTYKSVATTHLPFHIAATAWAVCHNCFR